jgi:predicted  nucleic acid-binding Zn-ribbon protein
VKGKTSGEAYEGLDPSDQNLTLLQRQRLARSEALRAKILAPQKTLQEPTIALGTPWKPEPVSLLTIPSLRSTRGLPKGTPRPLDEPCMRCGAVDWRFKRRTDGRITRTCQECGRRRSREYERRQAERRRAERELRERGLELHRQGKTLPLEALERTMRRFLPAYAKTRPRDVLEEMQAQGQVVIVKVREREYVALIDEALGQAAAMLDPVLLEQDGSRFARQRETHKVAA